MPTFSLKENINLLKFIFFTHPKRTMEAEFIIHNEKEYIDAVNRLDKLMDSLYGYKKVNFNDPDERTFYIYALMEKIEKLQDSINDYEVSLSELKYE